MKFQSKPSTVEAVQWTGDNLDEVEAFGVPYNHVSFWRYPLAIKASVNGVQDFVAVPVGHWIVRPEGDHTDHRLVAPDYFRLKYEPVGDRSE